MRYSVLDIRWSFFGWISRYIHS